MVFRTKEDPASQFGAANRAGNYEALADGFKYNAEYKSTENQSQSRAIAVIANRYRLTIPHARVVVELAQIGGHHG